MRVFEASLSTQRDEPPAWAKAVPRWQQIDAASYAIAEAWSRWQNDGVPQAFLQPDWLVLANARASNEADFAFARSGAISPSKFVATLPSVTLGAMLQTTGWSGPMLCLQNGAATLKSAFAECELLLSAGQASTVGVVTYELAPGARDPDVLVRYYVLGQTEARGGAS